MVILDEREARALRDFLGDESGSITIGTGAGHSGFGVYVWCTEYPEEGAVFLGAREEAPAAVRREFRRHRG